MKFYFYHSPLRGKVDVGQSCERLDTQRQLQMQLHIQRQLQMQRQLQIQECMLRLTSERQSGRWAAMRDERAAIKAVIEQSFGSHVDQFTSDFQNIVQNFVIILFDLD